MKPAAFDYHRPASLREALGLMRELGEGAKLLAGGQSLMPLMNFRMARPSALVDLNRVEELAGIRAENGPLVVGAMTRQYDLETSAEALERCPMLAEALRHVAHLAIRCRGTVGGSIAHADPTAELPVCAVALGAEMTIASESGRRTVLADEFFVDVFTTALEPAEVLVDVRFPALTFGAGWAFDEFALRRQGDSALVSVAALLPLGGEARVVLGGVAPRPYLVTGDPNGLADRIADEIDPADDDHIPTGYRRDLAREIVTRALAQAKERSNA